MSAPTPRRGRAVAMVVGAVVLVGFLLVGFFPTRTLLSQREARAAAQDELDALEAANAELAEQAERLQTPSEVERLAREEFGMVRPGEEAFAILPAPPPPVELPEVWPFLGAADELNR